MGGLAPGAYPRAAPRGRLGRVVREVNQAGSAGAPPRSHGYRGRGGSRIAAMSFKREGDDSGQLNVLQKRRVADLLANYIPEDEALLLRNGRYACTVCFRRPVFDTIDMLTVHRAGKKHVASLKTFYGKKRSQENEVQKRRQQEFLRAEEDPACPAPLLAQTRKITQNALLKASPYNSCCRRNRSDGSSSSVSSSRTEPAAPTAFGKQPADPGSSVARREEGCAAAETPRSTRLPGHPSPRADVRKEPAVRSKRSSKGKSSLSAQPGAVSPAKRQALEHYLLLRSSGWIQDTSGKWVKDTNVEFDSDEDEPPSLPPS